MGACDLKVVTRPCTAIRRHGDEVIGWGDFDLTSMYFIENMSRSHILRLDCSEGQFKSVSIDETLLAAVIIVKKTCCAALNAFNTVNTFLCVWRPSNRGVFNNRTH